MLHFPLKDMAIGDACAVTSLAEMHDILYEECMRMCGLQSGSGEDS